jgi:hypothetical protein
MFNKDKVVIRLSVGIGKNIEEAEEALLVAKTKKSKNNFFNIEIYNKKEKIEPKEEDYNKIIDSYLKLEDFLVNTNNCDKLKYLESFLYDSKTSLLNRVGYIIQIHKLKKENKYNNRVILFFDVDDMHLLNTKYGYTKVDEYLELIGKTLFNCIRKKRELQDQDFLNVIRNNPIPHRRNDSAGDEFVIDLNCPDYDFNIAKKVTIKYLTEIYKNQEEIS